MSSRVLKRSLSLDDLVISNTKRQRYDELPYLNPTAQLKSDSLLPDCQRDEFSSDLEGDVVLEIERLHKRKRLGIPGLSESKPVETNSSSLGKRTEKPLFTFDQVMLICGQKLKEREQEIRTKYDEFLKQKSAEQYDAFVKFTFDQILRNYESPPSFYLS